MQQVTIDLQSRTAKKFDKFVKLFGSKELFFDKFMDYHINRIKREISRMKTDLIGFENEYNLTSEKFYQLFTEGKLDDKNDYIKWAGIYELLRDSEKKLEEIL